MSDDLVVLHKYLHEHEARLAAAVLEANGIEARVVADNAGGAIPSMALLFPTRLIVRARDEAEARRLLEEGVEPPEVIEGEPER